MTTLDDFTEAYIATALWSSTDNADDSGGQPLDQNYSADDLAPATLARMIEDCAEFQKLAAAALAAAIKTGQVSCGPDFDEMGRAGHDFWLTRNGHGAGFWDGDWPAPYGDQLTAFSKTFGSVDLIVGDDGLIYS